MRILLVGEYSRLHNSLKEGLLSLGHEVRLVSSGDGFKCYPTDDFAGNSWCRSPLGTFLVKVCRRLFSLDLNRLERGLRFRLLLPKYRGYDVVQLINEIPVNTFPKWEIRLLDRLVRQNTKTFLLSSGVDYLNVRQLLSRTLPYSLLDPYFADASLAPAYQYVFDYTTSEHEKLHDFLFANVRGVIATDLDYVSALEGRPEFLGLIPNPVNTDKIELAKAKTNPKPVIFLGINNATRYAKGIAHFEAALRIFREKHPDRAEIVIAQDLPYAEYMKAYDRADILLDQVYSLDQGYNALEAMARGKVVFTGAGESFRATYKLENTVAIDAVPDAPLMAGELARLTSDPQLLWEIGRNARNFIEKEHDYRLIAGRYVLTWNSVNG